MINSWEEIEEKNKLKGLLYSGKITQYGKRKLITYYEEKIKKLIEENSEKDKEIKFWKEQAEGYQGLSQQIKEDYNEILDNMEV